MVDIANTNIQEAGPSEGSLAPGGGTAHGDLRTNTIASIVASLGSKSNEDLNHLADSLRLSVEAGKAGAGDGANKASIKSSGTLKEAVREDLTKIFGQEETLSEGFIDTAATLFEAAVTSRVAVEVEGIEEDFTNRLNEAQEDFVAKSTERLDTYLDYFANQFMEANQVAVENGIRMELSESFLNGIRDLFESHNVAIDAEQVNVVEELEAQIEELNSRLNEAVDANARVAAEIEEREISSIVNTVVEGMVESDKDRLITMAESIDYSDAADFKTKLDQIKGMFFEAAPVANSENGIVLEEVAPLDESGQVLTESAPAPTIDPNMSRYVAALASK